jgi:hypothetical protein
MSFMSWLKPRPTRSSELRHRLFRAGLISAALKTLPACGRRALHLNLLPWLRRRVVGGIRGGCALTCAREEFQRLPDIALRFEAIRSSFSDCIVDADRSALHDLGTQSAAMD